MSLSRVCVIVKVAKQPHGYLDISCSVYRIALSLVGFAGVWSLSTMHQQAQACRLAC
jgi:hypothetical protein